MASLRLAVRKCLQNSALLTSRITCGSVLHRKGVHDDSAQASLFPGAKASYTESMDFLKPDEYDGIPIYRFVILIRSKKNISKLIQSDLQKIDHN